MSLDLWHSLKLKDKPILIYGMGNGADAIIEKLKKTDVQIDGIFASDEFVRGQSFHGFKVATYQEMKQKYCSFIVLVAFGTGRKDVISNVLKIASEQELYIPDAPVYGKTFFDDEYYNTHLNELHAIKDKFYDKRSINVFDNIIEYKKSGKIKPLFESEDCEDSAFNDIIQLSKNNRIFDLGAFTGDTAEKFSKYCPDYKEIIAVEPSQNNFNRLTENTKNMRDIKYENSAISYLNGTIFFGEEGGRNQSVYNGKNAVNSVTIDFLCKKYGKPDFIKFDIEGEELNGLIGGEETIKEYKPKLMISAYHRSEDIISIPNKVLSLRDDYKMFIRHFPCIPCWDTYYIFI